eukprot:4970733-Prymnesium_polylepis.1
MSPFGDRDVRTQVLCGNTSLARTNHTHAYTPVSPPKRNASPVIVRSEFLKAHHPVVFFLPNLRFRPFQVRFHRRAPPEADPGRDSPHAGAVCGTANGERAPQQRRPFCFAATDYRPRAQHGSPSRSVSRVPTTTQTESRPATRAFARSQSTLAHRCAPCASGSPVAPTCRLATLRSLQLHSGPWQSTRACAESPSRVAGLRKSGTAKGTTQSVGLPSLPGAGAQTRAGPTEQRAARCRIRRERRCRTAQHPRCRRAPSCRNSARKRSQKDHAPSPAAASQKGRRYSRALKRACLSAAPLRARKAAATTISPWVRSARRSVARSETPTVLRERAGATRG